MSRAQTPIFPISFVAKWAFSFLGLVVLRRRLDDIDLAPVDRGALVGNTPSELSPLRGVLSTWPAEEV